MIDRIALAAVAEACRSGLEGLADKKFSMFHEFPNGACGPAAEILGRIVKERLQYDGIYVCGQGHPFLGFGQTHAWFEVGNLILDITHDQFEGTGLTGWIFEREGGWHSLFCDQDRRMGYCMPEGWLCYPHDGYRAAINELVIAPSAK